MDYSYSYSYSKKLLPKFEVLLSPIAIAMSLEDLVPQTWYSWAKNSTQRIHLRSLVHLLFL
jgi:hypothetical protein